MSKNIQTKSKKGWQGKSIKLNDWWERPIKLDRFNKGKVSEHNPAIVKDQKLISNGEGQFSKNKPVKYFKIIHKKNKWVENLKLDRVGKGEFSKNNPAIVKNQKLISIDEDQFSKNKPVKFRKLKLDRIGEGQFSKNKPVMVKSQKLVRTGGCFTEKPFMFNKKRKKDAKVIPLNQKIDISIKRHFPPAAQEWFNSIYAYSQNYTKLLPVADNKLMSLVRSYFNFYFYEKKRHVRFKGAHRVTIRKRSREKGLSTNKIFVAKGNLKHTSIKAVITLYLYNREKRILINKIKKEYINLYKPRRLIKKLALSKDSQKLVMVYNRRLSLKEYLINHNHYEDYITLFKLSFLKKLSNYFDLINKYVNLIITLVETKVLSEDEKFFIFNNKIESFYCIKYPDYKYYTYKVKLNYLKNFIMYFKLFMLNNIKFKHVFLFELKKLVSQVYHKSVEFNMVNLKKIHLNSDIFTQAVALKLKNRKNSLFRVLRSALSKVKLPSLGWIRKKYYKLGLNGRLNLRNKQELFLNNLKNFKINSLFTFGFLSTYGFMHVKQKSHKKRQGGLLKKWGTKKIKDSLNKLLFYIFPSFSVKSPYKTLQTMYASKDKVGKQRLVKQAFVRFHKVGLIKRRILLRNYILRYLKHIKMAGVRLEAHGRLTKRFTASRSVFKARWKGGLKNRDSSFRGLSAVILRGYAKSNIDYSVVNSKTRNGAFGIKGWVSTL